MGNIKNELVDDVHFVLREIERFAALRREWIRIRHAPEELREGFLWQLPHPIDEGQKVPCGRAGVQRVDKLARLAAGRAGIGRQVDTLTIRNPLAKALLRRFVIEKRPIDIRHVERSLSEAARQASRSLKTQTHYIPCHLMLTQKPEEFALGPIKFLSRGSFRKKMAER